MDYGSLLLVVFVGCWNTWNMVQLVSILLDNFLGDSWLNKGWLASVLIVADVSNVVDVEYSVWDIWNDVSDEFKGF